MDPFIFVLIVLVIVVFLYYCVCDGQKAVVSPRLNSKHLASKTNPLEPPLNIQEFVRRFVEATGDKIVPEASTHAVRTVIHRSRQQATKTQFAVLILSSKPQTEFETFRPDVNSKKPCMPDNDNYLVARPHNGKHAEIIMLEKVDALWSAYVGKHGEQPVGVFLYSWLMPCTNCTNMILDKLAERRAEVTVAYTGKNFEETKDTQENNRNLLKQRHITVYRYKLTSTET